MLQLEGRETGTQKLKYALDRYLEVNDFIFQSDKKLKEIVKVANNALICQGLILNNTLHGYLDIVMSEDSMEKNSKDYIVKVCAKIFDLNCDILTLVELEISKDCVPLLLKKELAKYVKTAMRRVRSQINCIEELINARTNDSPEAS